MGEISPMHNPFVSVLICVHLWLNGSFWVHGLLAGVCRSGAPDATGVVAALPVAEFEAAAGASSEPSSCGRTGAAKAFKSVFLLTGMLSSTLVRNGNPCLSTPGVIASGLTS